MISDFLFKNQIRMDVYKSYNHLMKTVLNNCNINPRTINLPVVSSFLKYIYFFVFKIHMHTLSVQHDIT
jgi:hypothetical protein